MKLDRSRTEPFSVKEKTWGKPETGFEHKETRYGFFEDQGNGGLIATSWYYGNAAVAFYTGSFGALYDKDDKLSGKFYEGEDGTWSFSPHYMMSSKSSCETKDFKLAFARVIKKTVGLNRWVNGK
jgi:hypothetical protein